MVRRLKKLFKLLIYISGAITIFCLFNSFREAFSLGFDLSVIGIKAFFNIFLAYKEIHGFTLTIFGIYFVVEQIEISLHANKITSRIDWRSRLELKLNDFENIAISDYILNKSNEIFDFLLENNLHISKKKQLNKFFKLFLDSKIEDFEKGTAEFNSKQFKYDNSNESYSLEQFLSFVNFLIEPSISYINFTKDFTILYMANVKKFNKDKIA